MLNSLLTALPQTTEPMKLDITWTITAIIAVSSLLSPIIVAIINNRQQTKMRKLELSHDEQLRRDDLQQQNIIHQFDIYYADKKKAFLDFLQAAGDFSVEQKNWDEYAKLQATAQTATLFCNVVTRYKLNEFIKFADEVMGGKFTIHDQNEYSKTLSVVVTAMSRDLESSKPCINCK